MADLRPTSRKSVLSVFAEDGTLVYEELVDDSNIVETAELDGVGRVVVLGRTQRWANAPSVVTMRDWGYAPAL